jgi:hypothetical protein
MKLSRVLELLDGAALTPLDPELEVAGACAASLMSDVLAGVRPHALLLTGLCSPQVIRTAQVTDIAAVAFVNGKRPPDDVLATACEEGLPLLSTPLTMFDACGRLYGAGLPANFCVVST